VSADESAFYSASDNELAALIATLHATGQRLEELTGGEVDAVIGRDGVPFLLRRTQDELRLREVARQAAILNALPAHIALIDNQGVIVSFNRAWQEFAETNGLPVPTYGTGIDYLATCDKGNESWEAAEGIRSVLAGDASGFSIEYPCHSPTQQRWFLMTVSPTSVNATNGAVIMHLDITERTLAQIGIKRLNRVYAVLREINALIVHVRDRGELFRESCRIAIETAGFRMAMVAVLDRETGKVVPVASSGKNEDLMAVITTTLSFEGTASTSMVSRAIREKNAIVSNNCLDDPQLILGNRYIQAGIGSLVVLPLLLEDRACGVLALYATETDFFHREELELLQELATNIAFAVDHIDKQEQLDRLACYDQLTGLANHHLFLERLTQCTRGAADNGQRLALFLIDLERFKDINDGLGQDAGDALLLQVGGWLTHHLGDVYRVARIGADHFAVVLPEEKHAGDLAQQLETMIEGLLGHPFWLNGDIYRIAAKFGVAIFPDDGDTAAILFKNAEAALKKAKVDGQRHLFYTQKMTETVAQRLNLENQLRQALDKKEFVLHYQPKVNLGSGEITGVEALIRLNDPRTGLVPPGVFIPILEETGLIFEVGLWALRQSLQDYLRWRSAGLNAVRIAVNVSPLQLRHPGFLAMIERIVAIDAHAAEGLELEITEGAIMGDMKQAIFCLQAVRALGISVAIDDFGTGFSSLGYLSKLPIDTLKIDRMFVTGMATDSQGLSLVSTIINLAHSLQLKVVAEGVETEEESRLLRLLKCDEMQGHVFSKPVPTDVLEEKFLARPPHTQ
jgi:diguanylate cyclase (GGDEF)-like protein